LTLQASIAVPAVALVLALGGCGSDDDTNTPQADGTTEPQQDCTPGYSPCLPTASDYDCEGGTGDGPKYTGRVDVTGSDPYDLDADGNGVGC
jgi:hypothetical protein